jgi:V/A-type H+-transporting ATPase subunit K
MDAALAANVILSLSKLGAAFAICAAAIGSAVGSGVAGLAAAGAWKKCYAQHKAAPFMLIAFIGLPLTQTIYGMIVMNAILTAARKGALSPGFLLIGMAAGAAIGITSWAKGQAGAVACDAMAETGKGFVNYLMALGVIETVSLFVMVFATKPLA